MREVEQQNNEIRLGYICPPINNPADFFIRSLSVTPGSEHESRRAINKICNEFAVSEAAMEVDMIVRYEQHMGSSIEVPKFRVQSPVLPILSASSESETELKSTS
uniref:Uncharacterized protein n=1 Tax=Timema cristinae TaxID=61476 RepID=A0A7R9DD16_TIMCR|nr:unnamed protein product [Timema cristinae]